MPISLRTDYDAGLVRVAAKKTKDGPQARRLLALAAIYEGASRTEAARIGGVTVQIVRDWVVKFNTDGPAGLIDRKPPGQPPRLTEADRTAVLAMIESGPIPAVHGVVRWRIIDLCQWFWEERQVRIAKQTLSRELRRRGIASCQPGRGIMPRRKVRLRLLKKPPSASGRNRARAGHWPRQHRDLVRR
jgi:transposase